MMKPQIFSDTPMEADAVRPMWFTMDMMRRNDSPTSRSWRVMGRPRRCNGHGDKGRPGVPETSENTADEVVADNGHHTAAADADIGHRLFKGFSRSIHPPRKGGGKDCETQGEEKPQQEAEADAVSRNLPALGSPAGSYILAHEDGDTHGEAGGEHGKGLEHLGPRGHSRKGAPQWDRT